MTARIFQPTKTAMQSGRAKTQKWVLEFKPAAARDRDPLMGWTGSRDTLTQVQLNFESCEDAVAYCERRGLDYEIQQPRSRQVRPKSYADNFRWDRPR